LLQTALIFAAKTPRRNNQINDQAQEKSSKMRSCHKIYWQCLITHFLTKDFLGTNQESGESIFTVFLLNTAFDFAGRGGNKIQFKITSPTTRRLPELLIRAGSLKRLRLKKPQCLLAHPDRHSARPECGRVRPDFVLDQF
jgi:hypothetical protein